MTGFKLCNFVNQTNSLSAGWHPAHKKGDKHMELLRSFKNHKGEVTMHKLYASYLVMKKQDGAATTRRVKQWELALSNYETFIDDLQTKNETEELFYPIAFKAYSDAIQLRESSHINEEEIIKALSHTLETQFAATLESTGGVIPEFTPDDFIKWFQQDELPAMIVEALYS